VKNRLELTWIGKDNVPRLEPRILLEDSNRTYHAETRVSTVDLFDNRLIFGDNLLALKSLEQELSGKVRCIYIDPPYNTGSAFAQYEDGLEHSIWLTMMRDRLDLLWQLLNPQGSLWVHLDDNEAHYCKVLLDEKFGRENFIANVVWKKSYAVRSNAQFFSTSHEHLLVYCRDRSTFSLNKFSRTEEQDSRYTNPDNDPRGLWQSVTMTISLVGGARGRQYAKTGKSENIYEVTSPGGRKMFPPPNRCWSRSREGFAELEKDGRIWWGPKGVSAPRLKQFLSETEDGLLPTTLWADGDEFGLNQQGIREIRALGLPDFPTPKPERLLRKVIELASSPGDWVLDSFAGTGTTGAVAHKMGRRWVLVELGEHCHTHIIPRLKKVIDGSDDGGISRAVGWRGGGGFRYYRLAPSLLAKDSYGNWIVNKQYNAAMLAEAVCKLEGYHYSPSAEVYWQHGSSSDDSFIYVTTQTLVVEQLRRLNEEVSQNRSLLICCGSVTARNLADFPRLTVKKIPKAVLTRCEWGRDDYGLAITSLPSAPKEPIRPVANATTDSTGARRKTASLLSYEDS
jgi:adenine-specific DNA-methyltransferase